MAHGYLTPTDLRSDRNYLGAIAGAIGSRIKKSSNMAARERAYASKQAEIGGTSLEEAGIGKGYFFKRALGSSFGGDRIARTRGRFETDPGPGRDPSGSQASRFRGGFDYGVSNTIKSPTKGALASIVNSRPGGPGGFLGAGAQAINPEVLGGELAKYQGTKQNAAGFSVDTTATEVKDLAGILNQIGQLIVRTSNSTIQAVDGVQRVNVRVVESVQSLGQLQVSIAERALDQQRMLAGAAEDHQEKMLARQMSAAEKGRFTSDDFSDGLTADKGYGFGGSGIGGILGGLFGGGGIGDILGTGLDLFGGRRRGRMSRAGRKAQKAQGLYRVDGHNFRNNSITGSALGYERIRQGKGLGAAHAAGNDITKRYAQRYGEKAALKRFGAEGLEAAGMSIGKSGMISRFLRPVFKRIPIFGGLIDFAVSLALGEPVGRAAAKAVGATLGSALGTLIPIPGVGTIAGGILGDFAGGAIYDAVTGGGGGSKSEVTAFASGGIINQPTLGMVGEAGAEGVFPLEGARGRKTFIKFGEGILEAQRRNKYQYAKIQAEGLSQYYDKQDGWTNGWKKFTDWIKGLGGQLSRWLFGNGDDDQPGGNRFGLLDPRRYLPNNTDEPYTGPISGETFNPLAAPRREAGNRSKNQHYGASRDGGDRTHGGIDITDAYSMGDNKAAPVIAYKSGKITQISTTGGGPGGIVKIDHGNGFATEYFHVDPRSDLEVGQMVHGGQKIADLHRYYSGGVEQTHLHFQVRENGTIVDPTGHYNNAKNVISTPLSDSAAATAATAAGTDITPEQVIPLPDGVSLDSPGSTGSNSAAQQRLRALEAKNNTIRKLREALSGDTLQAEARTTFENAKRERRNSTANEDMVIPGVGKIRYFDNKFFSKFTYFDKNGREVDEKTFNQLLRKRRLELKKEQEEIIEQIGNAREGLQASSASTNPDVLRTSATIAAADRASGSQVAFLSVPTQQQSGGGDSSAAMLAAMGQASSSPRGWTPSGIYNSILET
ncbi:2OG-Fe(II) oxygenase family like protein [Synechococcus phage S-RSM4]|uniref:2OG-Fe(II) oxygenase family like protein n=3 Tax=root TaxID=1 RepID=C7BVJ6_9CAUD|nr:2OG-Fe(II) oxygenase family like protein [Synechococcus phage S-RSM4]CAR63425.1 2OG-Fe(II) oxygenase family like protein [Synechococcus phage S-RSM4]